MQCSIPQCFKLKWEVSLYKGHAFCGFPCNPMWDSHLARAWSHSYSPLSLSLHFSCLLFFLSTINQLIHLIISPSISVSWIMSGIYRLIAALSLVRTKQHYYQCVWLYGDKNWAEFSYFLNWFGHWVECKVTFGIKVYLSWKSESIMKAKLWISKHVKIKSLPLKSILTSSLIFVLFP